MKKEELIEAIERLSTDLADITSAYQSSVRRHDEPGNSEQIKLQLTAIEKLIREYTTQLTILIAAEPTNGKNK